MTALALLQRLRRDARGSTIIEFAFVAPVFLLLILGTMDVGHTLYMRSVVQGAMQKAARDSGLETGADQSVDDVIDAKVKSQILDLDNAANVAFERRTFRSFDKAVDAREQFTDSTSGPYKNNICDHNEPYIDENNNGVWDTNGTIGQGDSKDTVVYTVTVTYARLFPLFGFLGLSPNVTVKATTVMNNQPYNDDDDPMPVRNCP